MGKCAIGKRGVQWFCGVDSGPTVGQLAVKQGSVTL